MIRTLETKFGEITLRSAMLDIDGTNLEEGIEIKLEGELIGEVIGGDIYEVEEMSTDEIEAFVMKYSDRVLGIDYNI